jgi:CubicO group peptidase (beta-lactamase class C family)
VRTLRIAVVVSLVLAVGQHSSAQSLTFSLLERYLESLREQAGIPGMSAAVVQGGRVVWDAGLGMQNVERSVRATADTPYPIADLSQTFAAAMLLDQCVDHGHLEINDKMRRWVSQYPNADATVGQILSHTTTTGTYRYDPSRFADLGPVVEQCGSTARYYVRIVSEVFEPLGMKRTVPGEDLANPSAPARGAYPVDRLSQYLDVLSAVATPYKVDSRGKPSVTSYSGKALNASVGVVSTVRDLARFDNSLDVLVDPDTLNAAWNSGGSRPTGLGWFVQTYNNERLVWHFGLARDAYSSLILKVPSKDLTFIVLANSDGLSAPYSLENGDVTKSLFAQVFLKLFVP